MNNSARSIHEVVAEIVQWATDAAAEHVTLSRFNGETPDPEYGMGLWQSFQARFPKDSFPGDYDLGCTVLGCTYRAVVKALVKRED